MTETLRETREPWEDVQTRAPLGERIHEQRIGEHYDSTPKSHEVHEYELHDKPTTKQLIEAQNARFDAYEAYRKSIVGQITELYHPYSTTDVDEFGSSVTTHGDQVSSREHSPAEFWHQMQQLPMLDPEWISKHDTPPVEVVSFTPANVSRTVGLRKPREAPNEPDIPNNRGWFQRARQAIAHRFRTRKHEITAKDDVMLETRHIQKRMPVHVQDGYRYAKLQTELAVNVDYVFDGATYADSPHAPLYLRDQSTELNFMAVRMQLPQSVANELSGIIRDNPDVIRQLAEAMVMKQREIGNKKGKDVPTAAEWRGELPVTHHRSRPPYEQLPEDWQLHMIAPDVSATLFDERYPQFSPVRHVAVEAPGRATYATPTM